MFQALDDREREIVINAMDEHNYQYFFKKIIINKQYKL